MNVTKRSFSQVLHSSYLPIKEVALKEWAVCIEALGRGEQALLVRKGGVLEETREFRLEETSFYLYPTYEHQRAKLIKEPWKEALKQTTEGLELPPRSVTITHAAHVVDDITFKDDEEVLKRLDPFHILTHDYAAERLHWQSNQPLHILLVRAYRLTEPKTIAVEDDYLGCRSWLTLKQSIHNTDLEPVLNDEQFAVLRDKILLAAGLAAE
jgi:hypothetical protein